MSRFVLFITLFVFATLLPAHAENTAQRWAQINQESSISHIGSAPALDAHYFVSEIYFDPSALNDSQLTLSAVFTPAGQPPTSEDAFRWTFTSSSIRKASEGTYEAGGEIQTDKGHKRMDFPFKVSLAGQTLLIDGSLTIKQGEFNFGALSPKFPAEIAANFHIAAEPLFSGDGKFVLE